MFTEKQKKDLEAPLLSTHVKEREQSGRKLSYIEGWWAISEANRIFGFDGWHRETVEIKQLGQVYENQKGNKVANWFCKVRIEVRTDNRVVIREGCGFGSGIDRDEGKAHESAIKEAETDAMKRALMTFGNPFGLALYDKTQANVEGETPNPPKAPKVDEAPKTEGQVLLRTKAILIENINGCISLEELNSYLTSKDFTFEVNSLTTPLRDQVREVAKLRKDTLKERVAA